MNKNTNMYMKMSEVANEEEKEQLIAELGDKIYISEKVAETLPNDFIRDGLASFANEMSEYAASAIAIYEYEPAQLDVVFMLSKEKEVFIKLESEVELYEKLKQEKR
jgi:hypothetical protein